MWYSIVVKETGIMIDGVSNFTDHLNRPLPDHWAYAPLNDLLIKVLTGDAEDLGDETHVIDYTKTSFNFSTQSWNIVYDEIELDSVDPIEVARDLKASKLAEATRKLTIPDLSPAATQLLQDYIDQLTALVIDSTTAKSDWEWPKAPF